MKKIIIPSILAACALVFAACQQVTASGIYIGAETATAAILKKNPSVLPTLKLLTADWSKYQGATLTANDEAALLQSIVSATKQSVTPEEAALLDGAVQQILANQNATAPTALSGGAAAIISTVMNGISREIVVYTTPTPAS